MEALPDNEVDRSLKELEEKIRQIESILMNIPSRLSFPPEESEDYKKVYYHNRVIRFIELLLKTYTTCRELLS